ncbi:MLO-like protein 1 [Lolium rigidum]|uniref:MLO-like protein 1 n=1 Tax=Lolium rigidum TaxID=89674 RepID=UPI001F5D2D84|nr:MLO-like protein 1 [Lolium rigidum]
MTTLEFTPTWVVAAMCSFIVLPSLVAERCLHYLSKAIKRKQPKPLYKAFLKIKQELLQGLVALLLTLFQKFIKKTCISPSLAVHMLPCRRAGALGLTKQHYVASQIIGRFGTRMLSEDTERSEYCRSKGKVLLLSSEVIHQLVIFVLVLAVAHVLFSVSTMILGVAKIRQWKQWESEFHTVDYNARSGSTRFSFVRQHLFVRNHFYAVDQDSRILGWLHSFVKQFYGSVTKIDYTTMRLGFINNHFSGHTVFDFHKYLMRVLQNDFKKVVGIRWYMWIFVVFYLLLNINGWHTYFWIAFLPLLLLLAIGTKLQHVINLLAREVHDRANVIRGDLVLNPSDDLFWFGRPRIILSLIHFILFQNAFEIAYFFWILITYGFNSCVMGKVGYTVPRLVIGVIIQFICSYITLPLYAIVTQMGSSCQKELFSDNVRHALQGWAQGAKMTARDKHIDMVMAGPSVEMMRQTSRESSCADESIE